MDQSFQKSERLSSLKAIGELFSRQNSVNPSFLIFPYKVVYKIVISESPEPQLPVILISVSKKKFKKAVDRNKIKRLTRESYRKNKTLLPVKIHIAFIYVGKVIPDLSLTEKSIKLSLQKINQELIR